MNHLMNRVVLPLAVLTLLAGAIFVALSQRPWLPRSDVVQPIEFSHRVHAGIRKIPCEFCHEHARRSQTAGVPPVSRCVGCHGNIAPGALSPVMRPWTDHRRAPFEIRWNRVYTLPDFVRFSHKPHINADIACQDCHGPVETMDRVVPVHEINMGFCISCHKAKKARIDCSVCHY